MTITRMMGTTMEFTAKVHHEDGAYWAEVVELPGAFASGDTLDELLEALGEAISMVLNQPEVATVEVDENAVDEVREFQAQVEGLRIAVPA